METEKGSEKDPRGHQMPPHPGPGLRGAPPVSSADLTPRSPPPSGPTFLDFSLWSLPRSRHMPGTTRRIYKHTPRRTLSVSLFTLSGKRDRLGGLPCAPPQPSHCWSSAPESSQGFQGLLSLLGPGCRPRSRKAWRGDAGLLPQGSQPGRHIPGSGSPANRPRGSPGSPALCVPVLPPQLRLEV